MNGKGRGRYFEVLEQIRRQSKRRSTKQKHLKNVKAIRRKVRRKAQRWMAFV